MDKGKGKLVIDNEVEESDQEFSISQSQDSQSEDSQDSILNSESEEEESEEEDQDELLDLLQEAQEYGDGGDMVDGLRSGKYRQKLALDEAQLDKSRDKAESSSKKRSAEELLK